MAMTPGFGFAAAAATPFVLAGVQGAHDTAAGDAIALIGGTIAAQVALNEIATVRDLRHHAPVLVVDATGAPDDAVEAALATVAMLAGDHAWRTIVAMAVPQIDLVIAALGDAAEAVHLLCDPDQAEWLSALAVASARRDGGVRSSDEDREQLARMNAEMARIAELLARLTTQIAPGGGRAEDRHVTFAPPPGDMPITAPAVREVLRARRLRDRFFGDGLFEDPAWDMLLDLFAAQLEGGRVSVSSLCIAAAVAPTTALRWITKLTAARLLTRSADPSDRRRAFVALTDEAVTMMHRYVAALAEARLPLV